MTKFNPADEAYFNVIDTIAKYGEEHNDRTGVGTKRIFGAMFKFDLMESFPIITCKKASFTNTLAELLYFLGGDPNIEELKKLGGTAYKWWEPFVKEDNTIGPIYPTQWRNLEICKTNREVIAVEKRQFVDSNYIESYKGTKKTSLDGIEYVSNNSGSFIITNKTTEDTLKGKRYYYDIQFINTGYEKYRLQLGSLKKGEIKDPFFIRVAGKGYLGKEKLESPIEKNLYSVWASMLNRCFNIKDESYYNYGAKGVKVDSYWFNFNNFLNDVKYLPGWLKKKNDLVNYHLDKDYYNADGYSKRTCVWLTKEDNAKYRKLNKPFKAVNKFTNKIVYDISIREFARKYNLTYQGCQQTLKGIQKHHKNWFLEYIKDYDKSKYVYRYPLYIDQIQNTIDLIKKDPNSRRICFTAWNPLDLYKQNLYICHSLITQISISNDGRLHMSTTQRSADVGIGIQHNWISYALLQIMLCILTGYTPGVLTYFVNDLHIYNNHLDALINMERKSYSQPQVEVDDNIKSIYDFNMDSFKLLNYKSGPFIKLPMAV